MRVLLISANRERINMRTVPFGLGCVAASLRRAGHQVTWLDLMNEDEPLGAIARTIADSSPEVIGVSVRNIDDQTMSRPVFLLESLLDVIATCKAGSNAPIVLGGAGFSMYPSQVLDYLGADYGIQGEGEVLFPKLLEWLSRGKPEKKRPPVLSRGEPLPEGRVYCPDLDDLPLPGPELVQGYDPADENLWIPMQTRRGCSFMCSYCATHVIEGTRLRKRSPAVVVEWIEKFHARGFKKFHFVDNSFNVPVSYATKLCNALVPLAGEGLTWRCIFNPSHPDEALIAAMAAAGCCEAALGFESGSEPMLKSLNKSFTLEQIRKGADLFAKYNIRRMGFLLLGGPGETRETVRQSLSFAEELGFDSLKVTSGIRIYPHTALARTAVDEGVIQAGDDLLEPVFYLAPGLEPWLTEKLTKMKKRHPNWFIS